MKKKSLAERRAARFKYEKTKDHSKLGSGKRFSSLAKSIEAQGKSKKAADAIAASIGRKKYGKKKMANMSTKGRKK